MQVPTPHTAVGSPAPGRAGPAGPIRASKLYEISMSRHFEDEVCSHGSRDLNLSSFATKLSQDCRKDGSLESSLP